MLGISLDPDSIKNISGILNSEIVKAKPFFILLELTAHVKFAWSYFKPALLQNKAVGIL